jgi:cytochrome P450
MEKSPIFLGAVGSVDGHVGVSLAKNEEHTRQRRALGFMFTNNALLQLESLMQIHIQKFVTILQQKRIENQTMNVSEWCESSQFSLICSVDIILRHVPYVRHNRRTVLR